MESKIVFSCGEALQGLGMYFKSYYYSWASWALEEGRVEFDNPINYFIFYKKKYKKKISLLG